MSRKRKRRFVFDTNVLISAALTPETEMIEACSDPDDDIFLEVAVSGKAECIVTRNVRDFPSDRFRRIPILTPEQFLKREVS